MINYQVEAKRLTVAVYMLDILGELVHSINSEPYPGYCEITEKRTEVLDITYYQEVF